MFIVHPNEWFIYAIEYFDQKFDKNEKNIFEITGKTSFHFNHPPTGDIVFIKPNHLGNVEWAAKCSGCTYTKYYFIVLVEQEKKKKKREKEIKLNIFDRPASGMAIIKSLYKLSTITVIRTLFSISPPYTL